MRGDEGLVHGSVRLGSALLCTARSKHSFVYCCVIAGACFDVTVFVWRKYATLLLTVCHLSFLPYFVLAMSVIGVTFLPVARFLPR
jgi:hypothetical protein